MRSRKQPAGKLRKKVTFMKRRQLRHCSCPPEDFEAILEEAGPDVASLLEKSATQDSNASAEKAEVAEAAQLPIVNASLSCDAEKKMQQPSAAPVSLPATQQQQRQQQRQQQQKPPQQPQSTAPTKSACERDAVTSATSHTLLAVPSAASAAAAAGPGAGAGAGGAAKPHPQCRRQALEQRVLLDQRRPPVDSVDNKAVVEQMMQRLSDMLRTLHPPSQTAAAEAAAAAAAAAEPDEASAAPTIAATPSPGARLLANCSRAQIPERYRQALRQLVMGSRQQQQQQQQLQQRQRSDWEKKLLYEK